MLRLVPPVDVLAAGFGLFALQPLQALTLAVFLVHCLHTGPAVIDELAPFGVQDPLHHAVG